MSDVFVTHTAYHLLLALGIAHQRPGGNKQLILITDGPGLDVLSDLIREDPGSPFSTIHHLPGTGGSEPGLRSRLAVRGNVTSIRRLVGAERVERIYVFNDVRPESQAAVHHAKQRNPKAVAVYVEDGQAAYGSQRTVRRWWVRILGKLLYGRQWQDLSVYGSQPMIDEVVALFPDLIRNELRSKRICGLEPQSVSGRPEIRSLCTRFLAAFQNTTDCLRLVDSVVLLAYTPDVRGNPHYRAVIECLSESAAAHGHRLAIKHHPLDPAPHGSLSDWPDGTILLPQAVPIEVLYLLEGSHLRRVMGDFSTGLMTARWLLQPSTLVTSFGSLLGWQNPGLMAAFNQLAIQCPQTLEELGRF